MTKAEPAEAATPLFLAPHTPEEFFARYWDQRRLWIRRDDPKHFAGVIDLEELDRLVTSERLPPVNLSFEKDDRALPTSAYCKDTGVVDKARALALHQQGATLILRSVEQWSPALNRLRMMAEELFQFAAQVNVYFTPASEKSSAPHWDTHDLFVLQLEGKKRWRLFEGRRSYPLPQEQFRVGQDFVSADCEEIVLHPGDTLYLPRGVIHEPVAETYSAHVSIGVHTFRWYDLVDTALQFLAVREGSPLRHTLPGWHRGGTPSADPRLIAELLTPEVLASAAADLRGRFAAGRRVDLQGHLLATAAGQTEDPRREMGHGDS
jgi:bifunctional lysine-specific demethylase and histidyl-hydroxylase NO66